MINPLADPAHLRKNTMLQPEELEGSQSFLGFGARVTRFFTSGRGAAAASSVFGNDTAAAFHPTGEHY